MRRIRLLAALLWSSLWAARPAAAHPPPFDTGVMVGVVALHAITPLVPKYTLSFAPGAVDHGLLWEVSGWLNRLGAGASFAYYPVSGAFAGRLTARLRLISLIGFEDIDWRPGGEGCCSAPTVSYSKRERLRVSAGLGAHVASGVAAGPRLEVRLAARIFWSLGFFAAVAYEPEVTAAFRHRGELCAGFETLIAFDDDLDPSRTHTGTSLGSRIHFF